MMEQVLAPENLRTAWRRVKTNAGAPGIDGMNVEAFPAFSRKHWPRIRSALMAGSYRPAPVRRVFIPKPDGSQRPLGVPTVLDRVIQQAVAQVLTPLYDDGFSDHSYGFREGRSAHQAVRHVEACWTEGRRHAVDCDLKSFFDSVNHDRLMGQLREKIRDRKVLGLIRRYLQAGVVLPDGSREATPQGVPQGGPLSPLLANITLDPLDKELERRGHRFARYTALLELDEWVRRRVRLYYWKQWTRHAPTPFADSRDTPRGSAYGHAQPERVLADERQQHCPTRPDQPLAARTRSSRHAHVMDYSSLRDEGPRLIGTAVCGPACTVVWQPG